MKNTIKLTSLAALMAFSFASQAELVNSEVVHSFDFNNGSLTDAISGNDLEKQGHGAGTSDVTFVTDRFGNENGAVAFDGKGAFLKWRQGEVNIVDSFLISFWIKSDEFGKSIKENGYRNSNTYWFDNRASGVVGNHFYISGGTSSYPTVTTNGSSFGSFTPTGDWMHYLHYRNDEINAVYLNGQYVSSSRASAAGINIAGDFALGNVNSHLSMYNLNGAIDDLVMMSGDYNPATLASKFYSADSSYSVSADEEFSGAGGQSNTEASNVPVSFTFAGGLALLSMFSRRSKK